MGASESPFAPWKVEGSDEPKLSYQASLKCKALTIARTVLADSSGAVANLPPVLSLSHADMASLVCFVPKRAGKDLPLRDLIASAKESLTGA